LEKSRYRLIYPTELPRYGTFVKLGTEIEFEFVRLGIIAKYGTGKSGCLV